MGLSQQLIAPLRRLVVAPGSPIAFEACSKPIENLGSPNLIAHAAGAESKTTSLPYFATANGHPLTDKMPMNVVGPKTGNSCL
jgi:hypothetical protein